MRRRAHAMLATCAGLVLATCDLSTPVAPTRCAASAECPLGYACVDGLCHAHTATDGAHLFDGAADRNAADSGQPDTASRDVGVDERPTVDMAISDAPLVDVAALDRGPDDAQAADPGPVDTAVADPGTQDTAAADLGPDDATAQDGVPDDTAAADLGPKDTTEPDQQVADSASGDHGPPDTASGLDQAPADGSVDAQLIDSSAPDLQVDSGPRDDGAPCLVDAECRSDFCRPSDWTCQAPTCGDGFLNQDETAIDCGGSLCAACPTCWGNAANFDVDDGALDFAPAVELTTCSPTINTSLAPTLMISGWCGPQPMPVVQIQTGGPSVVIVPMASLLIAAGRTLRLIGDKPVVLAVRGDATILGIIDAGAQGLTPGAGGDLSTDGSIATAGASAGTGDCNVYAAGTGQGMDGLGWLSLGGGGGGFRTNGGFGGGERIYFRCYSNPFDYDQSANGYECKPLCPDPACDNSFINTVSRFQANNSAHYAVAPVRGLAAPEQSLTPLRAGCAGGRGETRDEATAYFGGSGGGAVQISATGTLTIGAGGIVSAGGGGGTVIGSHGSGSGGGSGGAIRLEATHVDVSSLAAIRAHGGSGGGRDGGGGCSGTAENGHLGDDLWATHTSPASCVSEGCGGLSSWAVADPACNGSGGAIGSALACTLPVANWPTTELAYPQGGTFTDNNGGGGGGGSGGVIVVRRLVLAGACP